MELSIIIVNWNSLEYLKKCLDSIYSQTPGIDFEIVVVDNASFDGSGQYLKTHFPEVKFIQNKTNRGFGSANNEGFRHSVGEYILFLNPDTEVIGPAINTMLEFLKITPEAGGVGCKLQNTDGSLQTTCIQAFPTILNQMLDTDSLILRFPRWKLWGVKPLFFYSGNPEPVEVVTGACLMVKRCVFQSVGMFSSEYFMYGEDLDLCFKLVLAGRKNYYHGNAYIIHHGGKSADQASFSQFNTVHKRESVRIFFQKFRSPFQAQLYTMTTAFSAFIRLILIVFSSPWACLTRRGTALGTAFRKWSTVLKWSFGGSRLTKEINLKGV
jgi:N-acetylglucosaminyl-diphospho-decaprenol L-rhamnosyltransferase